MPEAASQASAAAAAECSHKILLLLCRSHLSHAGPGRHFARSESQASDGAAAQLFGHGLCSRGLRAVKGKGLIISQALKQSHGLLQRKAVA